MKTKTRSVELDRELFYGKSFEEVALSIKKGGKKRGTIRRFFGRISDWATENVDILHSATAVLFAITIAVITFYTLVISGVLSPGNLSIFAITSILFLFFALFPITEKKAKHLESLTYSWFSLIISSVPLAVLINPLWLIVTAGLIFTPITLGFVLSWRERKSKLTFSKKMSADEISTILTGHVNDFIKRHREKLVGEDTEYEGHLAQLKFAGVRIGSSLSYWQKRMKMDGVNIAYVERRISLLEGFKERAKLELKRFESDSSDILKKLQKLEDQIPLLKSEINDHYQDLLISEYGEGIEMLAEESARITMNHISSMREELLVTERAISALRLKVVPALEGESLIPELEARAEMIAESTSPQLAVVGF